MGDHPMGATQYLAFLRAVNVGGRIVKMTELKRIFRRFYRIPEAVAMRVKGSGLGLFIVSSVARKHGGRVSAESDGPGQGSTFTMQLPIAPTT